MYSELVMYRVRFTVQEPGGREGMGYTILNLNKPPTQGNCSISSTSGDVDTKWNITCSGFSDPDGIKYYTFTCESDV